MPSAAQGSGVESQNGVRATLAGTPMTPGHAAWKTVRVQQPAKSHLPKDETLTTGSETHTEPRPAPSPEDPGTSSCSVPT